MQRFTRAALCAVILALNVQGAWAESDANAEAGAYSADKRSSASQALNAQTTVSETAYESAFKGYRPYQEDEVRAWPSVNDEVGRIGGWRAYAREAMQGHAANAAPTPAGEAARVDPHTGHQMK